MAKYNEILTGRHNRFIQKLFSMKGAAPAPQLSGDIQMSHPIFHGRENRYLESWEIFNAQQAIAANAGNQVSFRLRNPPNSGVIGVLEKIVASVSIAQSIQIAQQIPPAAVTTDLVVFNNFNMDPRGRQNSTLLASAVNVSNILANVVGNYSLPANQSFDLILHEDHQWVILPGSTWQLQTSVVNSAFNCWFMWRERALEEGELK